MLPSIESDQLHLSDQFKILSSQQLTILAFSDSRLVRLPLRAWLASLIPTAEGLAVAHLASQSAVQWGLVSADIAMQATPDSTVQSAIIIILSIVSFELHFQFLLFTINQALFGNLFQILVDASNPGRLDSHCFDHFGQLLASGPVSDLDVAWYKFLRL